MLANAFRNRAQRSGCTSRVVSGRSATERQSQPTGGVGSTEAHRKERL
jgi:hypothetical protein